MSIKAEQACSTCRRHRPDEERWQEGPLKYREGEKEVDRRKSTLHFDLKKKRSTRTISKCACVTIHSPVSESDVEHPGRGLSHDGVHQRIGPVQVEGVATRFARHLAHCAIARPGRLVLVCLVLFGFDARAPREASCLTDDASAGFSAHARGARASVPPPSPCCLSSRNARLA